MAEGKKPIGIEPRQFYEELRSGDVRPVYLFEGEEEQLKSEALAALRKAVLAPGMEEIDETPLISPTPDDIAAAADTLPFMSLKRLVLIRDFAVNPKRTGSKKADESADAAETEAPAEKEDGADAGENGSEALKRVAVYVSEPPAGAVIVFYVIGKATEGGPLVKEIKKRGRCVSFEHLRGMALERWVVQAFRDEDKKCSGQAAQMLVFTSGEDAGVLGGEIKKIAAYMGDRGEVAQDDIKAVATRSEENSVFELTDALVEDRKADCWRTMQDLLRQGNNRFKLLSLLLAHFRTLQLIKILQFQKAGPEELKAKTGIASDWRRENMIRQATRFSNAQVKETVRLCVDTEWAIKSGRMNEEGSLEALMLKLFLMRGQKGAKA